MEGYVMMKKWKKIVLALLVVCLCQTGAVTLIPAVSVEAAAVKNGLKNENGKLYYYENGVKVKQQLVRISDTRIYYFGKDGSAVVNAFKTLKENGTKYSFYFGANGKAVVAKKLYGQERNFVLKKIKGVYYGFDTSAHRIKGMWVNSKGVLYAFNANGTYNASKTKTYRAAIKKYRGKKPTSDTGYTEVYSYLKKRLGKHTVLKGSSCFIWGSLNDKYTDITMQFANFNILLVRNERTKQYYFSDIYSR